MTAEREGPRYPGYPAEYRAVYEDARGSEETIVRNDGEDLYMRLRHVEFSGLSFDDWEPAEDTSPELLKQFTLEPRLRELREFTLTCEIPVPMTADMNGESDPGDFTALLTTRLELGRATPSGGADSEELELTLSGKNLTTTTNEPGTSAFFELALNSIQSRLPEPFIIKTCINCDLSDYSPYGQGLFGPHMACFRDVADEYRAVQSKDELFRVWEKRTEYVSELHLCPKFAQRVPGRGYRG